VEVELEMEEFCNMEKPTREQGLKVVRMMNLKK
jgi:hypothetical protein